MALVLLLGCLLTIFGGLAFHLPPASPETNTSPAIISTNGVYLTFVVPHESAFLGELLPVTVSLTNRTATSLTYFGWSPTQGCPAVVAVTVSGGTPPLYAPPWSLPSRCPPPPAHELPPARPLNLTVLIPLTASGQVTIRAKLTPPNDPKPQATGWPSVVLGVAPHAPDSKVLWLQRVGNQVVAINHSGVRMHRPLYWSVISCRNIHGISIESGTISWWRASSDAIRVPKCFGSNGQWHIWASVPGYRIASAIYNIRD